MPQPIANERELLVRYLQRQRAEVIATADGLTDAQARWTPDGKLLPIIGIVNHLTHVEWRWINGRWRGEPFPARGEEFVVAESIALASVIDAYRERGRTTDALIRGAASLEEPCLGREGDALPAHELLGMSEPIDLRWTVLHLIEETAHHAGHADATRELIDRRRMRA